MSDAKSTRLVIAVVELVGHRLLDGRAVGDRRHRRHVAVGVEDGLAHVEGDQRQRHQPAAEHEQDRKAGAAQAPAERCTAIELGLRLLELLLQPRDLVIVHGVGHGAEHPAPEGGWGSPRLGDLVRHGGASAVHPLAPRRARLAQRRS